MARKERYTLKIEYGLDRYYLPKKIHIVPSANEDIDILHSISSRLLIENPSIEFASFAHQGLYDKYTDEEYEKMLAVAKKVNLLFYSKEEKRPEANINIFDLLVRLLYEYMLNNHSEASRIL